MSADAKTENSTEHIQSTATRLPGLRRWITVLKNEEAMSLVVFDLDCSPDKAVCVLQLSAEHIGRLILMPPGTESVYGVMSEDEHDHYLATGQVPAGWETAFQASE